MGPADTRCAWCASLPDGRNAPHETARVNWGLCRECLRGLLESVLRGPERAGAQDAAAPRLH